MIMQADMMPISATLQRQFLQDKEQYLNKVVSLDQFTEQILEGEEVVKSIDEFLARRARYRTDSWTECVKLHMRFSPELPNIPWILAATTACIRLHSCICM